eukprot:CAMPEP_0202863362 /NCGR_PEP_ID=MMETSP1391-20130828/4025_1 /ASSEMBLY_ACC=CAM_ASM_000867 /TAXON_ID=1034604 /ORGANISM="Chlamydomonas leiostraca, Strain SAG 11-49" /LENGTH=274 /DNA_ID=CAMNT_0049542991 /DNA_START=229 /DNA_END=1054 /DNA_ORIENTATION=+
MQPLWTLAVQHAQCSPSLRHTLLQSARGALVRTCVASPPLAAPANLPYSLQHQDYGTHAAADGTHHHKQRVLLPGIELIMGPMFAGKSTTLLKRVRRYAREGEHVLLLKPASDTRYSAKHVVTHTDDREECHTATLLMQWREEHADKYAAAKVIGIDEAQFFRDLAPFVAAAADEDRKRVVVAGLDGDFRRARFGQMLDLVPLADDVTKLTARCMAPGCADRALFTQRTIHDSRQQLVGGKDIYRAVCRAHYVSPPEAGDWLQPVGQAAGAGQP